MEVRPVHRAHGGLKTKAIAPEFHLLVFFVW